MSHYTSGTQADSSSLLHPDRTIITQLRLDMCPLLLQDKMVTENEQRNSSTAFQAPSVK